MMKLEKLSFDLSAGSVKLVQRMRSFGVVHDVNAFVPRCTPRNTYSKTQVFFRIPKILLSIIISSLLCITCNAKDDNIHVL